jgi:hypothetical protein
MSTQNRLWVKIVHLPENLTSISSKSSFQGFRFRVLTSLGGALAEQETNSGEKTYLLEKPVEIQREPIHEEGAYHMEGNDERDV